MPDFYDMHVALSREKRTPKRTPLRDAAWPTAIANLLAPIESPAAEDRLPLRVAGLHPQCLPRSCP